MNKSLSTETLQQVLTDLSSSKIPSSDTTLQILSQAKDIIAQEPNVVRIKGNTSIIGNICGQYEDLEEALKHAGTPSDKNHLLFLGDIVNRGQKGAECLLRIVTLKLLHPEHVTILRGKLENAKVCELYGFHKEAEEKFNGPDAGKASYALFDVLPIAAIVNDSVFCVHGGLSPDAKTIADIEKIDRKMETPTTGAITDLIWSDPDENQAEDFTKNPRGAGFVFGRKPVDAFLNENKLSLIVRSNMLVNEGYQFNHDEKTLTIFSATNYCQQFLNRGAILKIDSKSQRTIITWQGNEDTTALAKKNIEQRTKKE